MKAFLSALILLSTFAASGAERVRFKENGFSIDVLEDTNDKSQSVAALVMTLPESGGFAPNVNVSVQPFTGKLLDYVKLSDAQFKEAKFKTLSAKKLDDKTYVWDYTGQTQNMLLHFYAKVIVNGKTAYLATATATEPQWVIFADKLKATVNSLKMD